MKELRFCNHNFILHCDGLLLWPSEQTAVASDLHLEKASHYAATGQLLPPQDSLETLQKLIAALEFSSCKKLILLGDSFHDEDGYSRLDKKTKTLFENLCQSYDVLFLIGNHDGAFIPPNAHSHHELTIKEITFRHEALSNTAQEISGHFHPKASVRQRGQRISRSCFIEDGKRMILPAFGTLTGGLNVTDPAIKNLVDDNFCAHLLGKNKIYSIPAWKL